MRNRYRARLIWLLACSAGVIAAGGARHETVLTVGQAAPDFHVTTYDGSKLSLADFKGQVLLLNFWATWCGPCRRELPLLSAYFAARQNAGLRMLAVATEDSLQPAQLAPVAKQVSFPMVRKFHGEYPEVKVLPTNVVIDRAGVIRYAAAGAFSLNDLNRILVPLLNEPPAPATQPIE